MKGFWIFFKYEFFSSLKPLGFAYSIGILGALLFSLFYTYEILFSAFLVTILGTFLSTISIGAYITFVILLIVRAFQTFWVEIFGDRGYLTLTLPLSLDSILLSKIIHLLLWILAALLLSPLIFLSVFFEGVGVATFAYIAELLPTILIESIYYITLILFIAALLNALKIRTFVLFKGFCFALLIQSLFFIILISVVAGFDLGSNKGFHISYCALSLCFSIVFYLGARYLIMHKLELE
ncbi:MAG: hypothetical protein J1E28_04285 [Helicobacter sp.]|uniref:hypothetical protein n=1 Tax=Helicobacter sp. TaxID=218 RepID=UPI0025C05A42|nr:hypothetical protein [Helicobacter sp.]MCH5313602.1 hypothetical protein [Helicobacter sp.]